MSNATFLPADLTTFCRLEELGLTATRQHLEPDRAVIECRVTDPDPWCRRCGAEASPRDTVTRRLAHEPFGHRPTTLLIRVRRYRCDWCRLVWREDTSLAAPERAKISRGGLRFALEAIDHLTVSCRRESWGVAYQTAILKKGDVYSLTTRTVSTGSPPSGLTSTWRHTRHGDKYVTVIMISPRSETNEALPGFLTWSRVVQRRYSVPGLPDGPKRGVTGFRSSRWTDSPDLRPPPKNTSLTRSR